MKEVSTADTKPKTNIIADMGRAITSQKSSG
jgi:hypothetical protein